MLYEFSDGVYINLREVVTMACYSNNTIEITMTNRKSYTRYCKDGKEMRSIRLDIQSGVTAAYHI